MTLLLLFTGAPASATNIKGYASLSDAQSGGSGSADSQPRRTTSTDSPSG